MVLTESLRPLFIAPGARRARESAVVDAAIVDEPFKVVTFGRLEVLVWSMASPAPIEAPVQREDPDVHHSVRSAS
jgi:hypothetical protein